MPGLLSQIPCRFWQPELHLITLPRSPSSAVALPPSWRHDTHSPTALNTCSILPHVQSLSLTPLSTFEHCVFSRATHTGPVFLWYNLIRSEILKLEANFPEWPYDHGINSRSVNLHRTRTEVKRSGFMPTLVFRALKTSFISILRGFDFHNCLTLVVEKPDLGRFRYIECFASRRWPSRLLKTLAL